MDASNTNREPPRWIWLYAPFAIFAVQIAARHASETAYQDWMRDEISFPEIGAVVLLAIAVICGIALLRRRAQLPGRWLVPWLALFTLGAFFFAGEEASWGQHYFGWKTPEAMAKLNEQGETGIHNLEGIGWIFDQAPRAVLTLGAAITVLVAILARLKPERFGRNSRLYWFLPTYVCVPVALLALFVRDIEKLAQSIGGMTAHLLDYQAGEFKEYFLAYLLMLYALSLVTRTRPLAAR